jgi:hypothetical protein
LSLVITGEFIIYISASNPSPPIQVSQNVPVCATESGFIGPAEQRTYPCNSTLRGQYVVIQKKVLVGYLTICEAEVKGFIL